MSTGSVVVAKASLRLTLAAPASSARARPETVAVRAVPAPVSSSVAESGAVASIVTPSPATTPEAICGVPVTATVVVPS